MNILSFILLAGNPVPAIHYYGWDVIGFWYRQAANQYMEYSWQVRTAYFILLMNVVTMIFLTILFSRHVVRRQKAEKMYQQCKERFLEPFTKILSSEVHWSVMMIERECECMADQFAEYDGSTYSRLICKIRMEMNDRVFLPNVQLLCELTGVRDTLETKLKSGNDVVQTLQLIDTLALRISEGRLAVYINHRDNRTRQMARLCLGLCTESDPFRYLEEDLDEYIAPARFMSLHRLFGWLAATNRQVPPFLTIASHVKNDRSAAFMIEEVAFWGNELEKKALSQFYMSDRIACRIAAMRAVARLRDASQEEELINTYRHQPEEVQLEILRTITTLCTGHQAAFLEKAYLTAPSKRLAECALSCLYGYGESGRLAFERLRQTPLDRRSRNLLDQIESMGELEKLRNGEISELKVTSPKIVDDMDDQENLDT